MLIKPPVMTKGLKEIFARLTEKYHLRNDDDGCLIINLNKDTSITLVNFKDFEYFYSIGIIVEITTKLRDQLLEMSNAIKYIDENEDKPDPAVLLAKMFVMHESEEIGSHIIDLLNRLTKDTNLKENVDVFKIMKIERIGDLVNFSAEICQIIEWTIFNTLKSIMKTEETLKDWISKQVPEDKKDEVSIDSLKEIMYVIQNPDKYKYDLKNMKPIGNA